MANILNVENLTKSVGDRLLFGDITFGVDEGDKIGIVAKNGTGKTTLLRVLSGEESADSGNIVFRNGIRVGLLEQEPRFAEDITVLEGALDGNDEVNRAVREYRLATLHGDSHAITQASAAVDALDAWDYHDRLCQMISLMGLDDIEQKVEQLSGGQRKRLALARVLMSSPDLLILDEPTNHLDIEIIEWLENYLTRARVTLLMVTHDRYFLDRICTKIMELDRTEAYVYQGNYDYYLRRRAERIEAISAELAKVRNTLRREQDWMSRQPQARGGKAKYRIDRYYELKDRSRTNLEEHNINLDGTGASYIGSKIFEARGINKAFGDKIILKNFSYTFARYEKLGIIGANGVGKSTFIKMLQGLMPPDSGSWDVGETVRFGYYSQDGIKFDDNKKVIDAITEIAEDIRLKQGVSVSPMQYLQRFLFSVPDQQKYIHTLSGGEKCRLHLATVLMSQPNFLILDEPTNDLDIVTLGILEETLVDFKGCVIVISHDRYFLDNIVDHLFVLEGNGQLRDFPGNYTEYRQWRDEQSKVENTPSSLPKATAKPKTERPIRLTFKEKKELEQLTTTIDTLTAEKTEIESRFNSGEPLDDIDAISRRYTALKEELDAAEMRWLELSEKE